jgi:hypothetical protein
MVCAFTSSGRKSAGVRRDGGLTSTLSSLPDLWKLRNELARVH